MPRIARQLRAAKAAGSASRAKSAAAAGIPAAPAVRPGELLQARARTARLRSRTAELDRLTQWCEGGGARSHLLSGPAGVGKSRLALELADRLTATGEWDVEFLAPGAELPANERPLLLVVEDAETRQEDVAGLLDAASARTSAGPTRVLLLARTRAGRWDEPRSAAHTGEELAGPGHHRGRTCAGPA